jgi:hypothetical protein
MMNSPYDLHSWSKQYHQEALHEVRTRQLEGRLRETHKARSERGPVSLALANVLSLVRGA